MRVALLSWESLYSIAVGGVGVHVTELAAALARRGHAVHLFTRRGPGQPAHDIRDGVHYHRCSYPPHADFVEDINAMCRGFVDRLFEVEDLIGRFDIVHAHDWLAANALIWAKQGRAHKGLLTIHSTEYARAGNAFPGGRSERVRIQERAGTYWADRVIAVSRAARDEILWMYEVPEWKVSVVYNGVEPGRFDTWAADVGEEKRKYKIAPLDPTVLFCGRMVWQKGPDLLVEAIPQILRAQPDSKFVFAGDGDMRAGVEARARHLGVGHAVRFLGHRSGPDLIPLFRLADAVCVPSRNEPFGIVVLEAWSARKPVIVTQNGGPNEYVRHEVNGLKIHPVPDSVAWGVTTMFRNFERARWMGDNGRRAVEERFTWDTIAEQTLEVYRTLCPVPQTQPPSGDATGRPLAQRALEEAGAPVGRDEIFDGAPGDEEEPVPVYMKARLSFRETEGGPGAPDPLAACRTALARSGLEPRSEDHSMFVKGDMQTVLAALNRCHRRMVRAGVWSAQAASEEREASTYFENVRSNSLILADR
jgi:glycogen synthase